MESYRLPQHIVELIERRWARQLTRDVEAWSSARNAKPVRRPTGEGRRNVPVVVKRRRR